MGVSAIKKDKNVLQGSPRCKSITICITTVYDKIFHFAYWLVKTIYKQNMQKYKQIV